MTDRCSGITIITATLVNFKLLTYLVWCLMYLEPVEMNLTTVLQKR